MSITRPGTYIVRVVAVVQLTIADPDAVDRCLTDEWRRDFYAFDTEQEVLEHLAITVGARGMDLSRLDGWADLPDDAVRADVLEWRGEDD